MRNLPGRFADLRPFLICTERVDAYNWLGTPSSIDPQTPDVWSSTRLEKWPKDLQEVVLRLEWREGEGEGTQRLAHPAELGQELQTYPACSGLVLFAVQQSGEASARPGQAAPSESSPPKTSLHHSLKMNHHPPPRYSAFARNTVRNRLAVKLSGCWQ